MILDLRITIYELRFWILIFNGTGGNL